MCGREDKCASLKMKSLVVHRFESGHTHKMGVNGWFIVHVVGLGLIVMGCTFKQIGIVLMGFAVVAISDCAVCRERWRE